METIVVAAEVRAEGRELRGVVMPWGERAADRRERFEAGSLIPTVNAWLELGHDQTRTLCYVGGGLAFEDRDGALHLRAMLPEIPVADIALAEIRAGERRGLSVRFRPVSERMDGDVRVIERATMPGVGLVRAGAYAGATVTEVRRRREHWRRLPWL